MVKNRKAVFILIVLVLAVLVPTTGHAQSVAVQKRHAIRQYMVQHQINGIVLVNGHDHQPLVISNRTDQKNSQKVSANQLFPIASLQKLVTGLAIMSLVNHHQIKLQTPLSDYYSGIPYANQITVQHLMIHHSGLRDLKNQPARTLKGENARLKFGLTSFQSTGDFSWKYSDADFIVLAAIIRYASHRSYHHYVMQYVMKPAHVKKFKSATKNHVRIIPLNKNVSDDTLLQQMSANFGAGDYLMTPQDYWHLVMTDVLENPRLVHQLLRVQTTPGEESYFGGVYVNNPIIHANGNYGPYNCCMWANVHDKQMLLFFANNISYHDLRNVGGDLFNIYFGYPYVKGTNQP